MANREGGPSTPPPTGVVPSGSLDNNGVPPQNVRQGNAKAPSQGSNRKSQDDDSDE